MAKRICGQLQHDALVYLIEEDLKLRGYSGDKISKFVDYKSYKGDGEIDIYLVNGKYILLFEVKCMYSVKNENKSKKQMNRAIENYFVVDSKPWLRFFKFMVTYDKEDVDGYKIRWLKKDAK